MQQGFRRPVSIVERIWLGANHISPPFATQVVFEGHGRIDYGHLRAAVAKASLANPGSRLILKGALRWAYWHDAGITPRVRIIPAVLWDGYGPENAPFLSDILPASGPTCEVVLLDGPRQHLIFRANHGVMDARGIYTWAEDVFRVLRGEESLGAYSNQTEAGIVAGITDKTRKITPVKSISPTGLARPGLAGATWRRVTLEGSFSRILLGKVGWALAQSAWCYGNGVVRLAIPVDLRPRRPGLRTTGNMCMALHVDVRKDSSPSSINRDIWQQIRNKYDCMFVEGGTWLDLVPIRILGKALRFISRRNMNKGVYDISALVSHIGVIETSMFSGGGFYADTTFIIPPCIDSVPAFVVLTGGPDRLEITSSAPWALADDNRLEQLLERITHAILQSPD